jgi:hypothetical protein
MAWGLSFINIAQVMGQLESANGWEHDVLALESVTNGHALSALGFYTIQRAGLIHALKLDGLKLARYDSCNRVIG